MVVALKALRDSQPRPGQPTPAERIACLEERVRDLLFRVWTLEKQTAKAAGERRPSSSRGPQLRRTPLPSLLSSRTEPTVPAMSTPLSRGRARCRSPAWSAAEAGVRDAVVEAAAPTPLRACSRDGAREPSRSRAADRRALDHVGRRGGHPLRRLLRGEVSIENDLIGPARPPGSRPRRRVPCSSRPGLGLHRRRDVPYLSEGLSGLGLGLCYLSLFAGYAYYDLLQVGAAFALMFIVTVVGTGVAVVTERQVTAVLALLGGLLTPVLLARPEPNERVLLGYLLRPRPPRARHRALPYLARSQSPRVGGHRAAPGADVLCATPDVAVSRGAARAALRCSSCSFSSRRSPARGGQARAVDEVDLLLRRGHGRRLLLGRLRDARGLVAAARGAGRHGAGHPLHRARRILPPPRRGRRGNGGACSWAWRASF